MTTTIKISDRMADALTGTAPTEDGQEQRMTSKTLRATVAGLMDRGLVQLDLIRSRRDGYQVHILTPRGMNVRERLLAQPNAREFLASLVDAAVRKTEKVATATEPTTPRPAMKTIKITGRMADALINTAVSEDERTVRLSLNVLVGTVVALMDRGFVEYNPEMSQKNGYPTHTFTPLGMAAQEQLVKENWGPNPKTFSREKLMAAAAKMSQPAAITAQSLADYCGERETVTGNHFTCTLVGPHDTHKAQGSNDQVVYKWLAVPGTLYATRNTADGAYEVVNRETGKVIRTVSTSYEARELADRYNKRVTEVTEYSVKIWYRSGAYEGVAHSPEHLARKIYADAVASNGVEFAELHGPSGKLIESKVPAEDLSVRAVTRRVITEHLATKRD